MSHVVSTRSLPAFTESTWLRYVGFSLLYVAQGVPEGVIFLALPAYLAMNGVSAVAIGAFIGTALLPWTFKLFNGPLMDRFSILSMGRRRPWVLLGQLGLVVSFAALAWIEDPASEIAWLTAGCVLVSFFGAFQDVAVDGMVVDVVPIHEQGDVNSFMWGGKTVGVAGGGAVSAWILAGYGFAAAVFTLASVIACIMLVPLLVRERPGERLLPWTSGAASPEARSTQLDGWADIGKSLLRVFLLPMSLIVAGVGLFNGLFRGFIMALLPLFTVQELGWTDTGYTEVMATAQLVAGLGGMALGGWLIRRVGRERTMMLCMGAAVCAAAGMGLLVGAWAEAGLVVTYIYLFVGVDTLFSIALFATAMAVCWKRVSATQFCLYMAISNLGMSAGSAAFGMLSEGLAYDGLFFAAATTAVVCGAGAALVRIAPHLDRLVALDRPLITKTPLLIGAGAAGVADGPLPGKKRGRSPFMGDRVFDGVAIRARASTCPSAPVEPVEDAGAIDADDAPVAAKR